jgi:hypothetical protein
LEYFPQAYPRETLHFRFKTETKLLGYVWKDITGMNDLLPQYNGVINVKILKLDEVSCSKRKSRLKLKNIASLNNKAKESADSIASKQVAVSSSSDEVYIDEEDAPVVEQQSDEKPTPISPKPQVTVVPPTPQEDLVEFDQPPAKSVKPIVDRGQTIDIDDEGPKPAPVELNRAELAAQRQQRVQENVDEAKAFLEKMNNIAKAEQEEYEIAYQKYNSKLEVWATNNKEKRNIRTLLTTMQTVLWPDSGWKTIGLGELLDPKKVYLFISQNTSMIFTIILFIKVKLQHRKAMLIVHPDRCAGKSVEVRFLATRIFESLNEAYQEFLKKESVD